MRKSSRHTNFIKKNWFNIATLLVSSAALVYAYESNRTAEEANRIMLAANQISINSSSSRIDLISYDSQQDLTAWVCPPVAGKSSSFVEASNVFTFVNRGGKAASLIEVNFTDGQRTYNKIKLQLLHAEETQGQDLLSLPVDIDAGLGRLWKISAYTNKFNIPYTPGVDFSKIRRIWTFTFSDGSTIKQEITREYYLYVRPAKENIRLCE